VLTRQIHMVWRTSHDDLQGAKTSGESTTRAPEQTSEDDKKDADGEVKLELV
jgi:hypothetical protein